MRRKTLDRHPSRISLFSFLDILGGTIGILTLIIALFLIQMTRGNQIVQIVSDGSRYQDRMASYIICNGDGQVELHSDGIARSVSIGSPAVSNLLDQIKSDSNSYLIIGVRPSGFDDFIRLRDRAERLNIPIGYEPLDDGWRIRAPGGELL